MMIQAMQEKASSLYKSTSTALKAWAAIIGSLVTIIGALAMVNSYVAKAADVEAIRADMVLAAAADAEREKRFSWKIDKSNDMQRKKYLEDKIFEYEQIPDGKHTQAEKAINERNKRERIEIIRRWSAPEFRDSTGG